MKKNILFFSIIFYANCLNAQIITTVAGKGSPDGPGAPNGAYSGDGGLATAAYLNRPYDVCIDAAGNLLILDMDNFRVRKVTTAGIITTIAGNGVNGFSGDGGPATAAQFGDTYGLGMDRTGNIYITEGARIRKINVGGIITTICGTGTIGYSGDGGPATAATVRIASDITADSAGNIFFADGGNHCIRKINTSGIITTIAGNGMPGFSGDGGPASAAQLHNTGPIAMDRAGNLYLTDGANIRIRKINTAGTITTIAGNGVSITAGDGGPASAATVANVTGIVADGLNNIYLVEGLGGIRKIDHTTGIISTIAGLGITAGCGFAGDGGPAVAAQFCGPIRAAFDNVGRMYIADYLNHRVRRLSSTLDVEELATASAAAVTIIPNPATAGLFTITLASAHNEAMQVTVTDITGRIVKTLTAETNQPAAIQLSASAGIYLVTVSTNDGVWKEKVVVE